MMASVITMVMVMMMMMILIMSRMMVVMVIFQNINMTSVTAKVSVAWQG